MCWGFKCKTLQYLEALGPAQHICGVEPPSWEDRMVRRLQGTPVASSWQGLRCHQSHALGTRGREELLLFPRSRSSHTEQLAHKPHCHGCKVLKSRTAKDTKVLISPIKCTWSVLLCRQQ